MLENRAQFKLRDGQSSAEAKVFTRDSEIGWLHGQSDNPNAIADITITDLRGVVQHEEKDATFSNGRFGRQVNLPFTDNQCIIKIDNVRNAQTLDIFVE